MNSKVNDIETKQTESKQKDEALVKMKTELDQTVGELKQAQGQLVMKDEQLIHMQDTMLKVRLSVINT